MNILQSGNNMSTTLQEDLAEFNIMRDKAVEGSKGMKGQDPKYFGLSRRGKEPEMFFPNESITELDSKYGMDMAIVVPDSTGTFDLLKPQLGARLSLKEPKTVRAYLRKLLESV